MKLIRLDGKTVELVRILAPDTLIIKELWGNEEEMVMTDKEIDYVA